MSKQIAVLFSIILVSATFAGCWSRREINELAIVSSVGIDKAPEGKIEITAEVVRPAVLAKGAGGLGGPGGGGGVSKGKPYWIVEATGETLIDAARNLNLKSPRQLFFSHLQVLVFGEQLARDGLGPVMDRLSRSNEVRRNIFVLITPGRAKDIIEAEPDIENISGVGLRGLVERQILTSKTVRIDLKEFLLAMASKSTSPVATKIEIVPDNRSREIWQGQGESAGMIGGRAQAGVVKSVQLTGTAVFHQDKLVGWLNLDESTGLLWVQGRVHRTMTVIRDPETNDKMAIETTRSVSQLKPELTGDKIKMTVRIIQEGDIAEHLGTGKMETPEKVRRVNDRLAEKIKQQAGQVIRKAQRDFHTDILGFGEAIRRKYPKQWAEIEPDWRQLYPQVEVSVDVRANIRRRNLTTETPLKPRI